MQYTTEVPSEGGSTYGRIKYTTGRTETSAYVDMTFQIRRKDNYATTEYSSTVYFRINGNNITSQTLTIKVSDANYIDVCSYRHYTNDVGVFDPVTINIGFSVSCSGTANLRFAASDTTISHGSWATLASGAVVNSIIDNGDNTLTIISTMGSDGTNNPVTDSEIYGLVDNPTGTPTWQNYDFCFKNSISHQISGRQVTDIIPAPSQNLSYMVRVAAYSISKYSDNPSGEAINSGECHYYTSNLFINTEGTMKRGKVWINDNGTWKKGIPWIKSNGIWKKGGV